MASEYITTTLWKYFPWGKEVSTATTLANACDTHILQKQSDLKIIIQSENANLKKYNEKKNVTKDAKTTLKINQTCLSKVLKTHKENFKNVRDAINLVLQTPLNEETIQSIQQLYCLVNDFSETKFLEVVSDHKNKIKDSEEALKHAMQEEKQLKNIYLNTSAQREVIEEHIREIKRIQSQLDEKLKHNEEKKCKNS